MWTHQAHYVRQLKETDEAHLAFVTGASVNERTHSLYMSLVGAVAFCLITRLDVAVFVVALQRFLQKPRIIHIKRLNAVVRYMQRTPVALAYERLRGDTCLLMFSAL